MPELPPEPVSEAEIAAAKQEERRAKWRDYKAQISKMPPAKRLGEMIDRVGDRVGYLVEELEDWKEAEAIMSALSAARTSLDDAARLLYAKPKDYVPVPRQRRRHRPRGESSAETKLEIDGHVMVKEKERGNFLDVMDPSEMDLLRVVALRGSRVIVETMGAARHVLRRSEVTAINGGEGS